MSIDNIRQSLSLALNLDRFDEPDTIEHLIVPVLEIAGWPIHSLNPMCLRRGNSDKRSDKRFFDLQLYDTDPNVPKFVFECKKLSARIRLCGKGASKNTADTSDFVRQLRNDCLNYRFSFCRSLSTPVLTNGAQWVIFRPAFTDPGRKNENISLENYPEFIRSEGNVNDKSFEDSIIALLRK